MKLQLQSSKKTHKAFLKLKPLRSETDWFKANLIELLGKISNIEKQTSNEIRSYTLDSSFIVTGQHLKYLISVLNSKLMENELNRFAPKTGTSDLIISVQALSPIQIPFPTTKQESKMNDFVDKIISHKQKVENTKANETLVYKFVYELYHLEADEINIIKLV